MEVFAQLADVARQLDKRLPDLEKAVEDRPPFSAPRALKKISELKREVEQLQANTRSELRKCEENGALLAGTGSLADRLTLLCQGQVSACVQYMSQYGYVPSPNPENETESSSSTEAGSGEPAQDITKDTQSKTPPQAARPPGRRTPQLEEFGISDSTMKILQEMGKKPPKDNRTVTKPNPAGPPEIPFEFQHRGFLCTPSLFPSCAGVDEGHASLASPDHLNVSFDVNVNETFDVPVSHNPRTQLQFDAPGKKVSAYEDNEPQEPELTYSHEALREMTGMFSITSLQSSSTTVSGQPHLASSDNKENTTPIEPELLSERVAKLNKEAAASSSVKPRTLYGDMPESPKFLMNYDFLDKK